MCVRSVFGCYVMSCRAIGTVNQKLKKTPFSCFKHRPDFSLVTEESSAYAAVKGLCFS